MSLLTQRRGHEDICYGQFSRSRVQESLGTSCTGKQSALSASDAEKLNICMEVGCIVLLRQGGH